MGPFPSPAQDYVERRISLDEQLIRSPSSTYFMRAGQSYWRAGIMKDALLVVDSGVRACEGSIVSCAIAGEFTLRRIRFSRSTVLERLDDPLKCDDLSELDESGVFGVVIYIINDARSDEFDDCPVM